MLYFFCSIPQHLLISLFVVVVFLPFWWSRTPTFHSLLFSGYVFVFLIHYVSYFPCFLVFAYPDISFLTFFGVHFRFTHTLCFIFPLLFSGFVPRYFIFRLFRGTFPSFSYIMFHIFLAFWWSRTPIFHFLYFSGYAPPHTSLIMASAHSPLPETYPAISFFAFFRGARLLVHHLLWLQHTPIHRKRTPTFYF